MTKIEWPFLQSLPPGIKGCEELGEILLSYAEGLPSKSVRCPLGNNATPDCQVTEESFQKYLNKNSSRRLISTERIE